MRPDYVIVLPWYLIIIQWRAILSGPLEMKSGLLDKSLLLILLAMAAVVFALWFLRSYSSEAAEYQSYLSDDRPAITLRYSELSGSWTEKSLKARFQNMGVRCTSRVPKDLGDRVCSLKVVSNNGVPTMFVSFFFTGGFLSSTSFNVPWWAHGDALDDIVATIGEPHAAQLFPRSGVRLMGWKLPDGAALFYNRDRSINPMIWSSVFWKSAESCAKRRCFSHDAASLQ